MCSELLPHDALNTLELGEFGEIFTEFARARAIRPRSAYVRSSPMFPLVVVTAPHHGSTLALGCSQCKSVYKQLGCDI